MLYGSKIDLINYSSFMQVFLSCNFNLHARLPEKKEIKLIKSLFKA